MAEKKLYPESIVRPTPNSIECPICGEIVRRPEREICFFGAGTVYREKYHCKNENCKKVTTLGMAK